MRIALIGCGRISKNHLMAIQKIDFFELAAVCDTDAGKVEKIVDEYPCGKYSDYIEMLEVEKPEIVSICAPSGLHAEQGIEAVKRGAHIIVEKPMALSLKDADLLIETCKKYRKQLFVVKQNRLNPTMRLLKKAIDKKRFGKIYMAVCNVFWNRPQSYYDSSDWRGTWNMDGGMFMNQGSHYVDALQWLLGPVESLSAMATTLAREIDMDDTGTVVLKFKNGCVGSMNITMLTFPKNYEGSITIIGEKGTVRIGGIAVNKIEHWEFADYDDDDQLVESINYNPPNVYGYGHQAYYENVVKFLNGDPTENVDGESGRKSLEIIEAIYRSVDKQKHVELKYG